MSILSLRTLICCALLCTVCSIYAQFNIKVGYNGNYANLEKTTSIFDRFSSEYTSENQELKSINFFHGIEFGARYKLSKNFGFDFGLSATNGKSKASDLTPLSSELSEIEWKISQNSIYIGLENYFGIFGYGASIGYQKLKYKNKTNLISEDIEVLNQNALNSRFYLIFEFASNKNAFSFRPFVSINWQSYNVYNIELTSFPDSNLMSTDFKEDFMVYGISFMIYNGPQ
jgi:hypothetical protein